MVMPEQMRLYIEIKNTYADFNVGPVNFLVGVQHFTLGRGFIADDDALA